MTMIRIWYRIFSLATHSNQRLTSIHALFQFTTLERILSTGAQTTLNSLKPHGSVLAQQFSWLLSAWIGISVIIDSLFQSAWPTWLAGVAYLFVGLAMAARYLMWTPYWFIEATPMTLHLIWLGIGLLLALTASLVFPGHFLGLLVVLAVEGHVILSFLNRRWGRVWFVGIAVLAACLYAAIVDRQTGLSIVMRAAPVAMAALIGLELLVHAYFTGAGQNKPGKTTSSKPSEVSRQGEISRPMDRQYVSQIEALAVAKERARIAREIHDTLGHTLTILDVQMELMARLPADRIEEIQSAARQSRKLVKEGLSDVRRSIRALHPNALEGFSIIEAIQNLVDDFTRASQIEVKWQVQGKVDPLAPELALPLHRTVQEALTNVRRHSGATQVKITLTFTAEAVLLAIEDNGCGQTSPKYGFGLSGIRDRVHELHGHFTANLQPGGGFRIRVKLPR
jgi:signal transduction histidine kinase